MNIFNDGWVFLCSNLNFQCFSNIKNFILKQKTIIFLHPSLRIVHSSTTGTPRTGSKISCQCQPSIPEKPILCNKRCRTCQTSELTLLIFSCLWTPYLTCYEVHSFARKNHITPEMCVNLQNASFHPSL